jgi:hypothetical protein
MHKRAFGACPKPRARGVLWSMFFVSRETIHDRLPEPENYRVNYTCPIKLLSMLHIAGTTLEKRITRGYYNINGIQF